MTEEIRLTREEAAALSDSVRNWRLVGENEAMRYWEGDVILPSGKPATIRRSEYLESELLLGMNEELRKESDGRRYTAGTGSDKNGNLPLVHVGQIPNNVFYSELAPEIAKGNRDHASWWLQRPENEKYRTNRGTLRKS